MKQKKDKIKIADELIITQKALVVQNHEKEKWAADLAIANKELDFQNKEKEKRADELLIANKELAYQNKEKEKRASELKIANQELLFQNEEKKKRAAELISADKELAFQNEENEKRAKELIIADKQLIVATKELEKTEEELKVTHERLLFHVDNTPLGYIEWDREGYPKYKSPKAEEIFGWTMKELLAGEKTAYDQVYSEDLPLVNKIVKQLINGEVERNRVQTRNITKDGRVIWCEWFNSVLKDKHGKVITIMSLVQDITEQKKVEENLWLTEKRFRALIEKSSDMKTLSTGEGEMIYCSPSVTKVLGYSLEEFIQQPALDFIHPDDIAEYAEKRVEILQTAGKSFNNRNRFLHKNGNWIWCEGTVTNMLHEPGINAMVSNFRDISEKITSETEKEFDSNNLNALINNSRDLMWSVDRDFNLITSNLPFDEMGKVNFGKTIAKGGNVLSSAYSPEMLRHFKELYERAFAGEAFTETEYFDFPVELWTEISYYPIRKSDEIIGAACHSRDITERKKSEETSLRLGSIVESSRDAIVSLSLDGLIVSWNYAAKVLYEYSSEEVLGKPYSILLHPGYVDQFSKNVERVKAGEQPGHFEVEHALKNGKLIYISLSISPVKNAAGNLNGIATNAHDISKQKIAEGVLKQAAYEAKTRWATKVKWELVVTLILMLSLLFFSVSLNLPKRIYDAVGNYQDSIVDDLIFTMAFSFFIGIVFGIRRFREAYKDSRQVQDALRTLTEELETRVQERTNELSKSNEVLLHEIIERKKTEENLKQSEARLREAQALSHISNWEVDLLTGIGTWSDEFYHILEIRKEDVQPSPEVFLSHIHPDDFEYAKEKLEKTFETFKGSSFFARINTKDETSKYIYSEWEFEFGNNNKPVRMYGILRDITKDKLAEINLKQSEIRFREFFDNAPEVIVVLDLVSLKFTKTNLNASKLFKLSNEEFSGKGPADISPEFQPDGRRSAEKAMEYIKKAIDGERVVFEWAHCDADKKEIMCEVHLASLADGDRPQIYASIINITERKKAEHQNKFKAELLNTIGQAVIATDLSGVINFWNKAAEDLYGWTTQEAIGNNILELTPAKETKEQALEIMDALSKGNSWSGEFSVKRKNGKEFPAFVTNSPIYDKQQKLSGVIGVSYDITERIKTEQLILKSQDQYRKAQTMGKMGHWETNIAENLLVWSDEIYRIFDIDKKSITPLYEQFLHSIHPEDIEVFNKAREEAYAGKKLDIVHRIIIGDGTVRIVHEKGELIKDEISGSVSLIGTVQDITEKKNQEELLAKASALARVGGWELDIVKKTLLWSGFTREIHEVESDFVPDVTTAINFYREGKSRNVISLKVQEGIDYGTPWDEELQITTAKGNDCWVKVTGISEFRHGKCVKLYGSFQDVTERKKAELSTLAVLSEKNTILESIGDGFFAVDKKWVVTYWNNQAEKLLYTSKDIILGRDLWEVFSNSTDSESYKKYHEAVETNQVIRFEDYYPTLTKWYEISAYPSDNGLAVYLKDITDRKLSEINLIELNANLRIQAHELALSNAELEQFAYVASHDLQEPLRTVTSFLTLLEKKYENIIDDKGKKYIHFAVDGSKRMRQIIEDLLEFSKIGKTEENLEDINLNEVINEIQISFQKQINEQGAVINVEELPVINSYKTPIRQAFQNLISNALKYSRKDMPVTILISATTLKDHWQFCVADNGIGIDSEYFDKIFIIFQRLHNKAEFSGTGIGLPVTKKIVENLGGRIWVESEEGKGSSFYFTIAKCNIEN